MTAHVECYGNPQFPAGIDELNELLQDMPDDPKMYVEALATACRSIKGRSKENYRMQYSEIRSQMMMFFGVQVEDERILVALAIPSRTDGSLDRSAALYVRSGQDLGFVRQEVFILSFLEALRKVAEVPAPTPA